SREAARASRRSSVYLWFASADAQLGSPEVQPVSRGGVRVEAKSPSVSAQSVTGSSTPLAPAAVQTALRDGGAPARPVNAMDSLTFCAVNAASSRPPVARK